MDGKSSCGSLCITCNHPRRSNIASRLSASVLSVFPHARLSHGVGEDCDALVIRRPVDGVWRAVLAAVRVAVIGPAPLARHGVGFGGVGGIAVRRRGVCFGKASPLVFLGMLRSRNEIPLAPEPIFTRSSSTSACRSQSPNASGPAPRACGGPSPSGAAPSRGGRLRNADLRRRGSRFRLSRRGRGRL